MQLSIIIINYNTFDLTCNCIQSLYDKLTDLSFEIILVDNASTACDPQLFKDKFPNINLIASKTNTGFAGGNNLGIAEAKGEYLLLLNSDTELLNNAPKICYEHIINNPNVGIVTCHLEYPDGKTQYNCRRFRTISWELLEIFPLYKLMPKVKSETLMLHHYFDHQRIMNCDWVWGTFMLFPKNIIQELPQKKLSEDFFMYCEDVLWSWQIKNLGYQIVFLPEAKILHIHKGSTKTKKLLIKNHAIFMKKFYPKWLWYIWASIYFSKQNLNLFFYKNFK